ncbi:MAG: ArsA family ATPase [Syntrophaceae bacterium]|nr:ArsA family ATPase [Syntrophaceae bacterium]
MRILFYTGKGGVRKSTMAAAAAWQLSKKKRVLVVSLDPAHNLGDIFCVRLNGREKRMSDNLLLREVDLQKLSRDYLEREIGVLTRTYSYLQVLNLDRYFSVLKYSPGIEEYALLTSIEETIRKDGANFDTVIFDTPPTGLTLRFLALPQITTAWIDRLAGIRRQILDKRHTIRKIRGPATEEEKQREEKLSYDEKDDAVLQRLMALKANYESLTGILQGPDCGVVLVFNPDMLSCASPRGSWRACGTSTCRFASSSRTRSPGRTSPWPTRLRRNFAERSGTHRFCGWLFRRTWPAASIRRRTTSLKTW